MRAKWLCVAALAAGAVGCGGGHVIFNVDVYSFIAGTGRDTVPYAVPPNTNATASTFQKISLLGAGSSLVDSVVIFGTDTMRNQIGSGTIGFQLFVAPDSAGTYLPGALAFSVTPRPVSGTNPVPPDTIRGKLAAGVNSVFASSTLWARVAAQGSNTSLITPLAGKMVIKSLLLTVVMNPKFF